MTTIVSGDMELEFNIYSKGAPNNLLEQCSQWISEEGMVKVMTEEIKNKMSAIITEMNEKGKVMALSYRHTYASEGEIVEDDQMHSGNLTLIALFGFEETVKSAERQHIIQLKQSGIDVRLVTADSMECGINVCHKLAILCDYQNKQDYSKMEGIEMVEFVGGLVERPDLSPLLETVNKSPKCSNSGVRMGIRFQHKFDLLAPELKLVSNGSHYEKYLLAIGLSNSEDNIVAITGQSLPHLGTLQCSHISIGLESSSDIFKDHSDLILRGNSLSGLLATLLWGRGLLLVMRRLIVFQLPISISALSIVFIGGFIFGESPLEIGHLLWINLSFDTLASIASAYETPNRVYYYYIYYRDCSKKCPGIEENQ